jgi:endogenous inhibitor of DNA gyrase (YacG/DUF329 family)
MCPICGEGALNRLQNRAFPFCSDRCKLVDLGRWLDGAYRVPLGDDDVAEREADPEEIAG